MCVDKSARASSYSWKWYQRTSPVSLRVLVEMTRALKVFVCVIRSNSVCWCWCWCVRVCVFVFSAWWFRLLTVTSSISWQEVCSEVVFLLPRHKISVQIQNKICFLVVSVWEGVSGEIMLPCLTYHCLLLCPNHPVGFEWSKLWCSGNFTYHRTGSSNKCERFLYLYAWKLFLTLHRPHMKNALGFISTTRDACFLKDEHPSLSICSLQCFSVDSSNWVDSNRPIQTSSCVALPPIHILFAHCSPSALHTMPYLPVIQSLCIHSVHHGPFPACATHLTISLRVAGLFLPVYAAGTR